MKTKQFRLQQWSIKLVSNYLAITSQKSTGYCMAMNEIMEPSST